MPIRSCPDPFGGRLPDGPRGTDVGMTPAGWTARAVSEHRRWDLVRTVRYGAAAMWTPWHRSRFIQADDLAAVIADLARRSEVRHVVLDMDNTVVPYGSNDDVERRLIDEAVGQLAALSHVETISIVSNAGSGRTGPSLPLPSHTTVVWSADKPVTLRSRLAAGVGSGRAVVIGDLLMTDGLLAWRLKADYYHCPIVEHDPYRANRVLGWMGRVVRPVLFTTEDRVT